MIFEELQKQIDQILDALDDALLDNNEANRQAFADQIDTLTVVLDDVYATLQELDHEQEYELHAD